MILNYSRVKVLLEIWRDSNLFVVSWFRTIGRGFVDSSSIGESYSNILAAKMKSDGRPMPPCMMLF